MTDHSIAQTKLVQSLAKRKHCAPRKKLKSKKRSWATFHPSDDIPDPETDLSTLVRSLPDIPEPVPRRLPTLSPSNIADNESDEDSDDSEPTQSKLPFELQLSANGLYAKSEVLERLQAKRRHQHLEATQDFKQVRAAIARELELEIGATARSLKSHLAESTKSLRDDLSKLKSDDYLITMEPKDFEKVWHDVADAFEVRGQWILEFSNSMSTLEINRQLMIENELSRLLERLVDIGFKIRVEIERDLEPWSQEINIEIIRNKGSYSELITMLKTSDLKLRLEFKREWEGHRSHWQELRHAKVVDEFKECVAGEEWVNPPERRGIWEELRACQRDMKKRCGELVKELFELAPPQLSVEITKKIEAALVSLRSESQVYVKNVFEKWDSFNERHGLEAGKLLKCLEEDLAQYEHKTPEEISIEIEESLKPLLDDLQSADRTLRDKVFSILSEEDSRFHDKIANAVVFYNSGASTWCDYIEKVEALEKEIDSSIDDQEANFLKELASLESELSVQVEELRLAQHREHLGETWDIVESFLGAKGKFEMAYRGNNQAMMKQAESHEVRLKEMVEGFSKQFVDFLGLTVEEGELEYATNRGTKFWFVKPDAEFCAEACSSPPTDTDDDQVKEDENEEKEEINWKDVVDPAGELIFEYLEFDLNAFAGGVSTLRRTLLDGLEAVEDSEMERAKKECEYRHERFSAELEVGLRKLRPRLPLCRNDVYIHREMQLDANEKRYMRHKRRCESLIANSKRRFEKTASEVERLIKSRSDLLEESLAALPKCEDRKAASILNKTLRKKSVETREEIAKQLDILRPSSVNLDTRIQQSQVQFLQGCLLLSKGGTYSEHEVEVYDKRREEIDQEAKETADYEEGHLKELEEKFKEFSSEAFFDNYKIKFEELSMRAGLGQKYGRPKRDFLVSIRKPCAFPDSATNSIKDIIRSLFKQSPSRNCKTFLKSWDDLRFQLKELGEFLGCLKTPLKFENVKYYLTDEIEEKKMEEREAFMTCLENAFKKWRDDAAAKTKEFYTQHGKHEVVGSCESDVTPEQEQDMAEVRKKQEALFAEWRKNYEKLVGLVSRKLLEFTEEYFPSYETVLMNEISKHFEEVNVEQIALETKVENIILQINEAEDIENCKALTQSIIDLSDAFGDDLMSIWESNEDLQQQVKESARAIRKALKNWHVSDHRNFVDSYGKGASEELCFIVRTMLHLGDCMVKNGDLEDFKAEEQLGSSDLVKATVEKGADETRSRFTACSYSNEHMRDQAEKVFGKDSMPEYIVEPDIAFDHVLNDLIIKWKQRILTNFLEAAESVKYILRSDFDHFRARY